ncbi:hypothetical protein Tco_0768001 [Tanacetum coccineum]
MPRLNKGGKEGASFTQGTIPSIPIGSSISPEGFLLLVLLLVELIIPPGTGHHRVPVGPVFLLGLLALAIDAACAFRAEEMPSLISCWMAAKVMAGVSDVDVLLGGILSTEDNTGYGMIHEDGDNDAIGGNDDERAINELDNVVEEEDGEWIYFLGGNSSSGTKKYRGSNSNDGGNIGDGVKIVGELIGSSDEIGFSKELKELLPAEAGK